MYALIAGNSVGVGGDVCRFRACRGCCLTAKVAGNFVSSYSDAPQHYFLIPAVVLATGQGGGLDEHTHLMEYMGRMFRCGDRQTWRERGESCPVANSIQDPWTIVDCFFGNTFCTSLQIIDDYSCLRHATAININDSVIQHSWIFHSLT